MTILAELIVQCRNLIGDTSGSPNFTDAILTDFINRAIADLDAHFPRRTTYTKTTTAGTRVYSLLTPHQQVISVEYPTGQTPPRYLQRKPYTDPLFWKDDGYYDYLPSNDAVAANPPKLYISATPPAGQTITLELTTEHSPLVSPTDETTIPTRLIHLIALFVRWKTWESLASQEGMDPNPLKGLTTIHGLNAQRAEESYRSALATAKAAYTESGLTRWDFPDHDRIY